MPETLRAKILVLSDGAHRGAREDRTGPATRDLLEENGWTVTAVEILPDDETHIRERLTQWTDADDCDVVFTCGGTGVGPRDVTPEATRAVIDKEIPGLAEMMRLEGFKKTRQAVLSRAVVGICKGKLIINLPGSVRGARESASFILDLLPHTIDLVQGRTEHPSEAAGS